MPAQTKVDKFAALDELFRRIGPIAEAMGGAPNVARASVLPMSATVDEQRPEVVPKLDAEMPDGFVVEFTPSGPLSTPYVLSVNVQRAHQGYAKTSSSINFLDGAWRMGQTPLSDDQIRAWLTLDGPPPARW
jgi:hypothetical protein